MCREADCHSDLFSEVAGPVEPGPGRDDEPSADVFPNLAAAAVAVVAVDDAAAAGHEHERLFFLPLELVPSLFLQTPLQLQPRQLGEHSCSETILVHRLTHHPTIQKVIYSALG